MTAAEIAAVAVAIVATGLADVRWLRVAQREHYLAGSATRFALRWWRLGANRVLGAAAVIGVVLSPISPFTALTGALAIAIGPFRYSLRGRAPGPLVWTPRLRTVAIVIAVMQVAVVGAAIVVGAAVPLSAIVALLSPLAVDGALALLTPLEDRRADRFVVQATVRLQQVKPTIIGITGSYGKTTTKVYAAHLIAAARTVVPTPASFNNRAGLSRAINEHLAPGTDVFIAEMGTYRKGEIAELCEWCPPRIAAITAIGPVHLERFRTEDAIVEAKREIFNHALTAILNIDDARLARLAEELTQAVVRCSASDPAADVCARRVDGKLEILAGGEPLAIVDAPDAAPANVAVAVALALAVDVPRPMLASALATLPPVANRRTLTTLSTGATAVDDTFNSNPAGWRAALATAERLVQEGHKLVVVTPGMVELGPVQDAENTSFATAASASATHLIIVGFTNRPALVAGASAVAKEDRAALLLADVHEHAVEWVVANTSDGDVVLYENQLPDVYP